MQPHSVWDQTITGSTVQQCRLDREFPDRGLKPRVLIINTRSSLFNGAAGDHQVAPAEEIVAASHSPAATRSVLEPSPSSVTDAALFERELYRIDDLQKPGMPHFDVHHLQGLSLSADQGPNTWTAIVEAIETNYHKYAGFVVQHGTDTLVYCATAISFMLENLGKPVMFTGSIIPANQVTSDMKRNIILAMKFAQDPDICEVCIVFAERVFRANRSIKISRVSLQPFVSPHMSPLAILRGNHVMIEKRLLHDAPRGRLRVHKDMTALVLTIELVPGIGEDIIMQLVHTTQARAIVICAFGTGNVPISNDIFVRMTKAAHQRKILVVVCSQNRYGTVSLGAYQTGEQLLKVGAIGAGDLTIETTIVKLKYLFGLGLEPQEVGRLMLRNLRGECGSSQQKLAHL